MIKLYSYLILIGFTLASFGAESCRLESKNHKLVLDFKKNGCEFPEGLVKDCIRVIHTNKKTKNENFGEIFFRKDIDFKPFCDIKAKFKYKTKLARSIMSSEQKLVKAYLVCPVKKQEATVILKIKDSAKDCFVNFKQ